VSTTPQRMEKPASSSVETSSPVSAGSGTKAARPAEKWAAEGLGGLEFEPRAMTGSERFGHFYHRLLVLADVAAIALSVAITVAVLLLFHADINSTPWLVTVAALVPFWVLIAYQAGLYGLVERRIAFDYVTELGPTFISVTLWCWLIVMVGSITASDGPNVLGPVMLWLLLVPLILTARVLARAVARHSRWYRRTVALIGDLGSVEVLRQRIERHPEWGLDAGLRLTRRPGREDLWDMWGRLPDLGDGCESLDKEESSALGMVRLVKQVGVDRVIIAGGSHSLNARIALAHTMLDRGIAVDFLSGGPETIYGTSITQHLEGMTLMSSRPSYPRPLDRLMKRAIDIGLSLFLLALTSPIMIFAAYRIKRDSPGPVFFRQERSGLGERPFEVLKLRTMYDGAHADREALRKETEADGNDDVLFKLDHDPRVTRPGAWLRRTSLDELPQLLNVLRGEMSMVGPRPLVPEEAEMASGMYTARFKVKPGIAGPWQSEGRSDIPFEDMLRLDYSYVAGWSMVEDMRLLLRTFGAVIVRKGAK